jgi:hypothetical protein
LNSIDERTEARSFEEEIPQELDEGDKLSATDERLGR